MYIKLCGLKTEEDVKIACDLKVWAVGFVLTKSPRKISLDICKSLSAIAGNSVKKVGVFTSESPEYIIDAIKKCNLDFAQIHGPYSEDNWKKVSQIPVIRAISIKNQESLSQLNAIKGETFILDSFVEGIAGGSGKTFDWKIAKEAAKYGSVILAGGLTSENVGDAIKTASPWGVDVSSGIEKEKGVKCHTLMKQFVEAVRKV